MHLSLIITLSSAQDCSELLGTLSNPLCHLNNVCEANAEVYLVCLGDAKARKKEMAINKVRLFGQYI